MPQNVAIYTNISHNNRLLRDPQDCTINTMLVRLSDVPPNRHLLATLTIYENSLM